MERSPFQPDEPESTDKPKKKWRTDFTAQWRKLFASKQNQAEQSPRTTQELERDEERPLKWRRFFKGFLRDVVTPPDALGNDDTPTPKTERIVPLSFLQPDRELPAAPEPTEETAWRPSESHTDSPVESEELLATGTSTLESSASRQVKSIDSMPASEPDTTTENNQSEQPNYEPKKPVYDRISEYEIQHNSPVQSVDRSQPILQETVYQRGGNALPLAAVGLEYLARKKADKKLDTKIEQSATFTKQEAQRSQQLETELRTVVRENREAVDKLKASMAERPTMPEVATKPALIEQIQTIETKSAPSSEKKTQPVKSPEAMAKNLRSEVNYAKPEAVQLLNEVAKAAETDAPIEKVFERSHEVKDDHSVRPQAAAASSVGSIVNDQLKHIGRLPGATANNQGNLPFVRQPLPHEYAQAMRYGFVTALCLIGIGVIGLLMIR